MPSSYYPRADLTAIIPSTTPAPAGVTTAVNGLDSAIENLRIGALEWAKMNFEQDPIPLEVTGGVVAVTIGSSSHLIYSSAFATLTTIYGSQPGDVLILELATGSFPVRIGNYWLLEEGQMALIWMATGTSFTVLYSTGWLALTSLKVYRDVVTQTIASTTLTKVQFNATYVYEPAINGNNPFTGSYQYLPLQTGLYRHCIQVCWSTAIPAGTYVLLELFKNGAVIAEKRLRGDGNVGFCIEFATNDYASSVNDYYEVYTQQNDVGSHSIEKGVALTYWTVTRLTAI